MIVKKKRNIKLLFIIGLIIIVLSGCSGTETTEEVIRVPVEAIEVSKGPIMRTITLSGVTEPDITAAVLPEIMRAEMVQSIPVRVGDVVNQGTVLAYLDSKTAVLNYQMAERSYADAALSLERNAVLYEAGAISKSQFEQVEAAYLQAKNAYEMRRIELSGYQVTSPISGVVSAVNVTVGNMASPQSPLAVVSKIDTLLVKTTVNEREASNISTGQQIRILTSNSDNQEIYGVIRSIAPTMDLQVRSFPVVIEIDNRDNKIQPGTFVRAEIDVEGREEAIVVPSQAVIIRGGQSRVFIIKDERAESVNIETGIVTSRFTEVTSGLKEGDMLITRGNDNVLIGDLVRIVAPIERQIEEIREEAADQ